MFELDPIDPSALATVHGGEEVPERSTDGLNTDTTQTRIGVYMLGRRIPIPYRYDRTRTTRTDYGRCVDESAQQCERVGGDDAAIGACKLNGIDLCSSQR